MVADSLLVNDDRLSCALAWADRIGQAAAQRLIVDSGSLLGLVREGGLLQNDIDFDLSVAGSEGIEAILKALNQPYHLWRYEGRIYKIEVPARDEGGPPIPADIKIFSRTEGAWISPAVGIGAALASRSGHSSGLRRFIRPAWRRLVSRMDASRFPLKWVARVDAWVIPALFFDDVQRLPGTASCYIPSALTDYLEFRYGEWQTPAEGWSTRLDDGGYHQTGGDR